MAKLRSEKARIRPQGGDESEDEDQECALSDQWTFQRHSRRWSRIVDLPDDPTGLQAILVAAGSAAATAAATAGSLSSGGQPKTIEEDDPDCNRPPVSGMTSLDETNNCSDRTLNCDPVILGSFRRSSSERLRHGAKSLLKRMESLRSRSRRHPALVRPADGNLVISGPQLVDASGMEDRMKELNCVDLTPPDSSASPTSSTPSPDLNRATSAKMQQQFNSQETSSSSMISIGSPTTMTASASSTPTVEATSSPAGSMKIKRGFFQRRSFRPSTSSSKSSGSTAQSAGENEQKDAHSDSECSPSYWRRSPSSSKDANSNETTTTTAWNSLEQSLRWKSKKSREPIPADMWRASTVPPYSESTTSTQMSQQRGKLYLNFSKPSAPSGKTPNSGSVIRINNNNNNNNQITEDMFDLLLSPPMKVLDLSQNYLGTGRVAYRNLRIFRLASDRCLQLTTLKIHDGFSLNFNRIRYFEEVEAFACILQRFEHLQILDLSSTIYGASCRLKLGSTCKPKIRELLVDCCPGVTDSVVEVCCNGQSSLHKLSVLETEVTHIGIRFAIEHLPELKEIICERKNDILQIFRGIRNDDRESKKYSLTKLFMHKPYVAPYKKGSVSLMVDMCPSLVDLSIHVDDVGFTNEELLGEKNLK